MLPSYHHPGVAQTRSCSTLHLFGKLAVPGVDPKLAAATPARSTTPVGVRYEQRNDNTNSRSAELCWWRLARSSATDYVDVANPATAEVLARTPLSTLADVNAAVQAAAAAFPAWRRTPPGERVQYLFKLKNLLEEHIDEIARLITRENGKTFAEAKARCVAASRTSKSRAASR